VCICSSSTSRKSCGLKSFSDGWTNLNGTLTTIWKDSDSQMHRVLTHWVCDYDPIRSDHHLNDSNDLDTSPGIAQVLYKVENRFPWLNLLWTDRTLIFFRASPKPSLLNEPLTLGVSTQRCRFFCKTHTYRRCSGPNCSCKVRFNYVSHLIQVLTDTYSCLDTQQGRRIASFPSREMSSASSRY
jgi:hypothetical protein